MPLVAGPQYLGLAAAQEGGTTGIRARSRALGSAMEMRTRRGGMTMIGVLAYGSLITDPGPELAAITLGVTKDVLTPFPVEFARKSRKRSLGNRCPKKPYRQLLKVLSKVKYRDHPRSQKT